LEVFETDTKTATGCYRAITSSIETMKKVLDSIEPDSDCINLKSELHMLKGQIKTLFEQSSEYAKLLAKDSLPKKSTS
jgi:hypothetical protein